METIDFRKNNKQYKVRQMTILLEYKESTSTPFDQPTYIANAIAQAIAKYNANRLTNYSLVSMSGLWLEPTDEEGEILGKTEIDSEISIKE